MKHRVGIVVLSTGSTAFGTEPLGGGDRVLDMQRGTGKSESH